jgi:N-acetylglucosaminyldiphosphoundecaprenol N-acetyl-beta-D-mannosaminyltransferase
VRPSESRHDASSGRSPLAGRRSDLTWGRVIGLPVAVSDLAAMTGTIAAMAARGEAGRVCVANVHMLVTARRDPAFREVLEQASIVVSDGTPLVWDLRRQGFAQAGQVRGPDLMLELCRAAAERQLPLFFYGGDEALIARLREELTGRFPGLPIAGAEAAPMLPQHPEVDPETAARIRRSGARIVFVGLGCPKQEFWMQAYGPELDAVLIGVGQGFAIAAGVLAEAPAWMRARGLEWLFRLLSEPRRLGSRYLVTNSLFLAYQAADRLRRRS